MRVFSGDFCAISGTSDGVSAPRSEPRSTPTRPRRRSVLLAQTWWEDRVLRGVAAYAAAYNWELECRMRWTHALPDLREWRGDGIIAYAGISRSMAATRRQLVAFARRANLPVVDIQGLGDFLGAPKVFVPHQAIGEMAARYFLALNFRDLGYVLFDDNELEQQRQLGFRRAVESAGARFHSLTPKMLRRTIARLPRPMALFAVNDPNALRVLWLCREAGINVPEEFAIMGVDDTEIVCDLAAVPLTSINCNFERQGYEAAALLDRLMNGHPPPVEPTIVPPREVTIRRSTDTIAIPDLNTTRMLRFLRDRYREPRSIEQIATALHIPLRRVHGIFRQHVGHTPLQELTRLRVEHAKRLLRDTKSKLETIGLESGFSNRFHFVQAFRRVTGQTPKAFRRAAREMSASER